MIIKATKNQEVTVKNLELRSDNLYKKIDFSIVDTLYAMSTCLIDCWSITNVSRGDFHKAGEVPTIFYLARTISIHEGGSTVNFVYSAKGTIQTTRTSYLADIKNNLESLETQYKEYLELNTQLEIELPMIEG